MIIWGKLCIGMERMGGGCLVLFQREWVLGVYAECVCC